MAHDELRMTPVQMASLLDEAFRNSEPLVFLNSAIAVFKAVGRFADGTAAAWIGCLLAKEKVEILMGLRAAWLRGDERSPAEAAQAAARCRLGID